MKPRLHLGLVVAGIIALAGCNPKGDEEPPEPPPVTPPSSSECITFDELTIGNRFHVGNKIPVNQSWVSISVEPSPFQHPDPFAEVQGLGGGGGPDRRLWIQNPSVKFVFDPPLDAVSFIYVFQGGDLVIEVNSFSLISTAGMSFFDGKPLGGARITVDGRKVTLCGESLPIDSFEVAGQELEIDSVCIAECQ